MLQCLPKRAGPLLKKSGSTTKSSIRQGRLPSSIPGWEVRFPKIPGRHDGGSLCTRKPPRRATGAVGRSENRISGEGRKKMNRKNERTTVPSSGREVEKPEGCRLAVSRSEW